MKTLINNFIKYVLLCNICFIVFYYILLPNIIKKRAQDLGLLKYNSIANKMVEKDSLHISGWDLYYKIRYF